MATPIHLHNQISLGPIGASLGYESFIPIPWRFDKLGHLCRTNQLHRGCQPSNTHLTKQHYTENPLAPFNQVTPLLLPRVQKALASTKKKLKKPISDDQPPLSFLVRGHKPLLLLYLHCYQWLMAREYRGLSLQPSHLHWRSNYHSFRMLR